MRIMSIFILGIFLFPACDKKDIKIVVDTEQEIFVSLDPLRLRAAEIVSSLEDRVLVSQIFISGIDGRGSLPLHMRELLVEFPVGGVMLFRFNLDTSNDAIYSLVLQTSTLIKDESGLIPFIAVDHEGGTVNRFSRGVADLPAANSYWELFLTQGGDNTIKKIEDDSSKAGSSIAALGLNMNFAPIAEYLMPENQVFLYSRSYGPYPFFTAEAASAFVRGMKQSNVMCVAKHFPGSAGIDPHYSASVLNINEEDFENLIYPFAYLIENGIRAIMIAHTLIPQIDSKIASLSSVFMEKWLRDELGFEGIIICDDFSMAAAGNTQTYEAAVQSVIAGSDMILVWPNELRKTHQAFMAALEDGTLSRERLQDAAGRIIYEKLLSGLIIE